MIVVLEIKIQVMKNFLLAFQTDSVYLSTDAQCHNEVNG